MNILVVCHYGLYENLTYSFVHNQIKEYVALGHRVRVVIPVAWGKRGADGEKWGAAVSENTVDGVELCYLRYVTASSYGERSFNHRSLITSFRMRAKKIMGDFVPDVIHAHTLGFDSAIGAWLKQRFSCPLVVTTHGSDTSVPYFAGRKAELKAMAEKADAVVCVSSALERRLADCGVSVPLRVIHNGFQITSLPEDGTVERDPFAIVQAGNLIPSKRFETTLYAVETLRKKYPQVTFTIVGDGPEMTRLKMLVSMLGMDSVVCFCGRVSNRELLKIFSSASYYVMPSVREGFGIVYLEAMAAGCVAVGTEGEGIADIITSGKNGFLVPADDPDAIVAVLEDCFGQEEMRENVRHRGQADALELTWERTSREYIALFETLNSRM
ncbi:MAG: glycosyltransferase [Firmicutes bacterium]|nr:glycosyltransferase [Bacillota bacterium]